MFTESGKGYYKKATLEKYTSIHPTSCGDVLLLTMLLLLFSPSTSLQGFI